MAIQVLVAGAGKSSYFLIQYLLQHAKKNDWFITVMDGQLAAAQNRVNNHTQGRAIEVDITHDKDRRAQVAVADLVISLMPPYLHILLAKDCLDYKKSLITASYVSEEIRSLHQRVQEKELMFMCEMGLDPGIDHMSCAAIFNGIRKVAGSIKSFKSYCGGLVAPDSDDNPWHYKISWNPRNVVTAGMGGADFLIDGRAEHIAHEWLFHDNRTIQIPGNETLSWYANRDSISYKKLYELEDLETIVRATLRHPDFTTGWDAVVQLGLNSLEKVADTGISTYADWVRSILKTDGNLISSASSKIKSRHKAKAVELLQWLGIFEQEPIPANVAPTSADILLSLLEKKWAMKPDDKDRVVMHHEIVYEARGNTYEMSSSMTLIGENKNETAMAKTVGLPMGILAHYFLNKKIQPPIGVHIPVMPEVYKPVLAALEKHDIIFREVIK